MRIEFVGGARTVTGSCFILKNDSFTIMVDRGMFQGKKVLRDRNYMKLIYAPGQIDALLLTHAHIDHSGLIPKMVKDGYTHPIYATRATVDLCSVMLPDSAHIQEMDAVWINKKNRKMGLDPVEPIYTVEDAEKSIGQFVPVRYDDTVQIVPGVTARFRDAGHILGSSFIELEVKENGKATKILFSGDVGSNDQAIIRDPEKVADADIVLVESTYGDRLHKSRTDTYEEFKTIISNSFNRKGNIIIPSFAVERTQEIVYTLGRLFKQGDLPPIPVYIDSPLAVAATEIFKRNKDLFDEDARAMLASGENPLEFKNLHYIQSMEESKRLNDEARGAIIISASGMCTAGRIKYHLQNNLYRPESSVIFVGYQAEGTLGRKLVDGARQVRILGDDVAVRAKVHTLGGFSAHADRDGLMKWLSGIRNPKCRVFVVHGEENSAESFAATVKSSLGLEVYVPRWGEIVDLDTMSSTIAGYGATAASDNMDREMESLRSQLDGLIARYREAREGKRLYDTEKLGHEINDLREMMRGIAEDL